MNAQEIIESVKDYCKANQNEANVKKFSHYFKEAPKAWGLTQPQINSKAKEIIKSPGMNLQLALQAANEFIKFETYEEVSFGILLVNGFPKQFTHETLKEIEKWFELSIHNWAHADGLGMFILPQFIKHNVVHYSEFKPWVKSKYKFQRRCVPVTYIKAIKADNHFEPYFKIIEPLMADPEREVHQGVGWFLREAWKLQPEVTEKFLLKWKDEAPRLIIQYATEKMKPEEKVRFKKSK